MKSISGKITSTKKISLSKASNVLSKFLRAVNGAPQAVSSYLRRTSASFDELVQLHKDLKPTKPDRKPKKLDLETTSTLDIKAVKKEENEGSEGTRGKNKRKSEGSSSKKETKRRRIKEED